MNAATRKRLEAAGWRVATEVEFLKLTPQQVALIEMKLALRDALKLQRARQRISQTELARRIASSQSRIAKLEAGDSGATLDLMIKALLAAGATRAQVGRAIAGGGRRAA
jgi:DNA-binding XRE family transcriptional regulator